MKTKSKKSIYDNPAMIFIGKLADLTVTYLLWIICCIPLITIGASTSALYSVMIKIAKGERYHVWSDFTESLKSNFKVRTVLWVLILLITAFLTLDLSICSLNPQPILDVVSYIIYACLVVFYLLAVYAFPVQGRDCGTIKETVIQSILCSTQHFFLTMIVAILPAIPFIVFHFTQNKYVIAFILIVAIPFLIFVQSFTLAHIFSKMEESK